MLSPREAVISLGLLVQGPRLRRVHLCRKLSTIRHLRRTIFNNSNKFFILTLFRNVRLIIVCENIVCLLNRNIYVYIMSFNRHIFISKFFMNKIYPDSEAQPWNWKYLTCQTWDLPIYILCRDSYKILT